VLGQNRGRGRTGQWSKLGTTHRLANRNAGWQHATWWWPGDELLLGILVQWVRLVVAENLEHYGLSLQVLDKGFGHGYSNLWERHHCIFAYLNKTYTYILHMVEA